MSKSETFSIGYMKISEEDGEEIFLSVTPNFLFGPGIQRDGLTSPRMTDPHTVEFVMNKAKLDKEIKRRADFPATDNPYIQRAGTWTLFHHARDFIEKYGDEYRIIGIQSCGDLTMNPWHVALINENGKGSLCHLDTDGDPPSIKEPIHERVYRCLVKWKKKVKPQRYEFIDLKFINMREEGYFSRIVDAEYKKKNQGWFEEIEKTHKKDEKFENNITPYIDFALSGKPIVHKGQEISLENAIDLFIDVRHIFNLPTVKAHGALGPHKIKRIYFGEYILFNDPNVRRGALNTPIIVGLEVPEVPGLSVHVYWDDLEVKLEEKHYKQSIESPTRRGEYRKYSEKSVEIFFPLNVYPFGVLGGKPGELVCLSSGGLSGRVGNTLEGMTRMIYDFFGCEDAIVLDEGYDTFHIINPKEKQNSPDAYKYDNEGILKEIAKFTLWQSEEDEKECKKIFDEEEEIYKFGPDMRMWPLNYNLFKDLDDYKNANNISSTDPNVIDIMAVRPHRSQIRSIIIFAVPNKKK